MEKNGWKFLKIFAITWEHLKRAQNHKADIRLIRQSWASQLMALLNVEVEVLGLREKQDLEGSQSMILVSNHISYTDIGLVLKVFPNCCFVAKRELKFWPIIGPAAAKADTIFVKRESKSSRLGVRSQILKALKHEKKNLVIFPSGTTKMGASEQWKKGAFEIAFDGGFKVQPFRIRYSPLRPVAYIDDDFFPTHAMNLFKEPLVRARIEFGEAFYVQDVMQDLAKVKAWCEEPLNI